jgi:hypothetical protein
MGKTQILGSLVNTILTDSSNNVGIGGAANASYKLQVTGTTNLTGALSGTDISLQSSNFDILKWQKTSGTASNVFSLSADSAGCYIQDVTNTKTLLYLAENTGNATFSGSITSLAASGAAVIVAEGSATSGEGLVSVRGKNSSGTSRRADFKYDNADVIRIATASPINMQFETNDIPRMTITSGGNVGIGVTNPDIFSRGDARMVGIGASGASDNLALALNAGASGGRGAQIYMGQGGTRHFTISSNVSESTLGTTSNTPLKFTTNDTERMRITSDGAMFMLRVDSNLTFADSVGGMYVRTNGNNSSTEEELRIFGRNIGFYSHSGSKYASITSGGNVLIGGTTSGGRLDVRAAGLSAFSIFVRNSNGGYGGGFYNTGGNNTSLYLANSSGTETVLINSSGSSFFNGGKIGIGTSSPVSYLTVNADDGGNNLCVFKNTNTTNGYGISVQLSVSNTSNWFYEGSASSVQKILIYSNGNIVNVNNSYGTLSDISLKENIVDATPKLNDILNLKVRNFNLKNDENKTKQIGFIAQEIEEIFPNLVDIDNSTNLKSIKTSVLVPMLVKAIQELNQKREEQQAQIEELKGEIDILKGKI